MKPFNSIAISLITLTFLMVGFQNCGPQLPTVEEEEESSSKDNGSTTGSGGGSFTYAPTPTPTPTNIGMATPTPAPQGPTLNSPSLPQFVQALYMNAFDRFPSEAETQGWVGSGRSRKSMRIGFAQSEEFLNRNMSIPDTVTKLYRILLNREADAPGRQHHEESLAAGNTRAALVEGMINTAEFQALPENQ